jgi:hypothetical protein
MTPRTWAEKKVTEYELNVPDIGRMIYKETGVALLMAEHARSVRIVEAEIKRVTLDQHTLFGREKDIAVEVLNSILAALQRGRTGRGK